MKRTKTDNS